VVVHEPPDHQIEISRFARVIEAGRTRHLAIAATKDQDVSSPPALPGLVEQTEQIVGANGSFEAMQN
jgi:hypothetical protein